MQEGGVGSSVAGMGSDDGTGDAGTVCVEEGVLPREGVGVDEAEGQIILRTRQFVVSATYINPEDTTAIALGPLKLAL